MVSFDLTVPLDGYRTYYLANGAGGLEVALAEAVRNDTGLAFSTERVGLPKSNPDEIAQYNDDTYTDTSGVLKFYIACQAGEVSPTVAQDSIILHAAGILPYLDSGLTVRTADKAITGAVAYPPPASPPLPENDCLNTAVDKHIRKPGIPITQPNGAVVYEKKWCFNLEGTPELDALCASKKWYYKWGGKAYRCIPGEPDVFYGQVTQTCTASTEPLDECVASPPPVPAGPPASSSTGGALVLDDDSTAQTASDDCLSDGGVAGVAIATFVVGFVIGGLALSVYFKQNAPVKMPGA